MIENALPDDPTPRPLKATPLDAWHRALGARMVPFAGYAMPVQYQGVLAEHLHCRGAGGAVRCLPHGPGDAVRRRRGGRAGAAGARRHARAEAGPAALHAADQRGGRHPRRPDGGQSRRRQAVPGGERQPQGRSTSPISPPTCRPACSFMPHEDRALLALQGPAAAAVIGRIGAEAARAAVHGRRRGRRSPACPAWSRAPATPARTASRSRSRPTTPRRWRSACWTSPRWSPAGLGARDSLRLEAGLCLYGNDIDELTTPIEAGLAWAIGKRRRAAWDFPGAARDPRPARATAPTRRRVGIRPDGRAPARALTEIVAGDGTEAGTVTSGGFSPTLSAPIAMGYVRKDLAADGTALHLMVRGKPLPARVVPMPFVPHRYAR